MRHARRRRGPTGRTRRRSGRASVKSSPAERLDARAAPPAPRRAATARRSGRRHRRRWWSRPGCRCSRASRRSVTPARGCTSAIAAHLHGQPIGAAPDGGREVGAQDHLHRRSARSACRRPARAISAYRPGPAVASASGSGSAVCARLVGLPFRDVGAALPDHAAGLLADPVGVPGIDRLAEPGVAHERPPRCVRSAAPGSASPPTG